MIGRSNFVGASEALKESKSVGRSNKVGASEALRLSESVGLKQCSTISIMKPNGLFCVWNEICEIQDKGIVRTCEKKSV